MTNKKNLKEFLAQNACYVSLNYHYYFEYTWETFVKVTSGSDDTVASSGSWVKWNKLYEIYKAFLVWWQYDVPKRFLGF